MSKATLLNLLADGEYRSGQDLADALGVSRTAVWKQINKFTADLGLEVESQKGRGYRIPGGIDLLNEDVVRAKLDARAATLLSELRLLDVVDSTNTFALAGINDFASGFACSAEQQTAGRGRRGRQWVSPYAGNIYLSLLWQYEQGAAALEGLSLAVGVGVAQALAGCGIDTVQLKWPNDVLVEGAKLGGILIEMAGDAAGPCQVVVGVGLNVAMPTSAARDIDQRWTDLNTLAPDVAPTRSVVLASLLNHLLPLLADFGDSGFSPWRCEWQKLDAFEGERVILDTGERKTAGIARGVDERGALLLETSSGVQAIYGGEISMRPAN